MALTPFCSPGEQVPDDQCRVVIKGRKFTNKTPGLITDKGFKPGWWIYDNGKVSAYPSNLPGSTDRSSNNAFLNVETCSLPLNFHPHDLYSTNSGRIQLRQS
jgi:hypothetical protein